MVLEMKIKRVENGFILERESFDLDLENCYINLVFEDGTGEDGELDSMFSLLSAIKEYFGIYYSKHNHRNLLLQIEESAGKG